MVSDEEENVNHGMMSEDRSLMERTVDINDCESDEGCEDVVSMLPNDPFGMELNLGFQNDPSGRDINNSLPIDPFDMDFDLEVTVATVAGWMEDCRLETCGFETDEASGDKNVEDNKFYAEVNFVLTAAALRLEEEEGEKNVSVDTGSVMHSDDELYNGQDVLGCDREEFMCFGCEKYQSENVKPCNYSSEGSPPDALFFALNYLDIRDLLSVEMVCKSLCDSVRNDPLLWRNFHIDYPLSNKITNDELLRLTNRAQGSLRSLSLFKCLKITNAGLKHVLQKNPGLTKLSVPGCIKLRVDGVLQDLKVFNSGALPGIRHLRVGELFGLTNQHFKEFKLLLGVDDEKKSSSNYKPRFYQAGQYLSLDDDRVIDIETCPRCEQARQVYDCPTESCKAHSTKTCRACIFCIIRCVSCGCCLDNKAHVETFSLDLLCLDCFGDLLGCHDSVALSPRHTYFHPKASYHFIVYS